MELIQLEPYPPQLAIVFSKQQHDELCRQLDLDPFGKWDDTESRTATTFTFNRSNYPHRLMVVEFYHPNDLKFNTISHEGIHVMSSLMEYVGLNYDVNNDEWYAYQHDFIVNAICAAHDRFVGIAKEVEKAVIATGNHPKAFEQTPEPAKNPLDELNFAPSSNFLDDK